MLDITHFEAEIIRHGEESFFALVKRAADGLADHFDRPVRMHAHRACARAFVDRGGLDLRAASLHQIAKALVTRQRDDRHAEIARRERVDDRFRADFAIERDLKGLCVHRMGERVRVHAGCGMIAGQNDTVEGPVQPVHHAEGVFGPAAEKERLLREQIRQEIACAVVRVLHDEGAGCITRKGGLARGGYLARHLPAEIFIALFAVFGLRPIDDAGCALDIGGNKKFHYKQASFGAYAR